MGVLCGIGVGMLIVAGMWMIDRVIYTGELAVLLAANNRMKMKLAASAGKGRTPC